MCFCLTLVLAISVIIKRSAVGPAKHLTISELAATLARDLYSRLEEEGGERKGVGASIADRHTGHS